MYLCKQCHSNGSECEKGRVCSAKGNIYFGFKLLLFRYLVTYWPTYSMQQIPSWEANCIAASQETPRTLWVLYCIAFARAHYLSLFRSRLIQSMPISRFPKINFNIIRPYMPVSCKCFLFLNFHHQKLVCASPFPHTCYMPRISHSPWFYHDHAFSFISLYF